VFYSGTKYCGCTQVWWKMVVVDTHSDNLDRRQGEDAGAVRRAGAADGLLPAGLGVGLKLVSPKTSACYLMDCREHGARRHDAPIAQRLSWRRPLSFPCPPDTSQQKVFYCFPCVPAGTLVGLGGPDPAQKAVHPCHSRSELCQHTGLSSLQLVVELASMFARECCIHSFK
jgi:hypothetical protein